MISIAVGLDFRKDYSLQQVEGLYITGDLEVALCSVDIQEEVRLVALVIPVRLVPVDLFSRDES
jgi:hypothetical protein